METNQSATFKDTVEGVMTENHKLKQQLAKQAEQLKEVDEIIKLIENLFCFFMWSDKYKKAMVEIHNAIQKYKGKE